jgi:hypothetical protein
MAKWLRRMERQLGPGFGAGEWLLAASFAQATMATQPAGVPVAVAPRMAVAVTTERLIVRRLGRGPKRTGEPCGEIDARALTTIDVRRTKKGSLRVDIGFDCGQPLAVEIPKQSFDDGAALVTALVDRARVASRLRGVTHDQPMTLPCGKAPSKVRWFGPKRREGAPVRSGNGTNGRRPARGRPATSPVGGSASVDVVSDLVTDSGSVIDLRNQAGVP